MIAPEDAASFRGLRIVCVADVNVYARSMARIRAFRELGAEVVAIAHTVPGDPRTGNPPRNLLRNIAAKLRMPLDWMAAGRRLLTVLRQTDAHIVWIDKGSMLRPQDLAAARLIRPEAIFVWFSEDDMFAVHNRTARFDQGLSLYDMVFTTKSYNADPAELPALGAKRVAFVFQAYDPAQHHPVPITAQDTAAVGGDIGFIGSFEQARAQSMFRLAQAGLSVRVWGNGWDRCPYSHPNLRLEGRALVNHPPDDLACARAVIATRINLGFLRKMNRDLHTSRSFEIPATGGFMLAERTVEHLALYQEGVEAEFFGSDDELIEKARRYLKDEQGRRRIAQAGHRRCITEYGSVDQAKAMLRKTLALRQAPSKSDATNQL